MEYIINTVDTPRSTSNVCYTIADMSELNYMYIARDTYVDFMTAKSFSGNLSSILID